MYILPPLPYATNALEPVIDTATVELHYGKHHTNYANKLNELIKGTEFENTDLETIVKKSSGTLFNNAGQVRNHNIYRSILRPAQENNLPHGETAKAITEQRGSFDAFKEAFINSGMSNFGSGRTRLVKDNGTLDIVNTSNAQSPLTTGKQTLIGIDIREHSYYLKYQNRRLEYLTNIWQLINRDAVEKNFYH